MHKSAIFVEIRGALGMSQNPLFSPTHTILFPYCFHMYNDNTVSIFK